MKQVVEKVAARVTRKRAGLDKAQKRSHARGVEKLPEVVQTLTFGCTMR